MHQQSAGKIVETEGVIPESEESQGEVRTVLPPDAIEFVVSKGS